MSDGTTKVVDGPFAGRLVYSTAEHYVFELPIAPGRPRQYAHYRMSGEGYVLDAITSYVSRTHAPKGERE